MQISETPAHRVARSRFIFSLSILALLNLCRPAAGAGEDLFAALQKQLIKDGFNAHSIQQLYTRPEVFFETKGAALFFVHSEARLDYDQFANDWSIRRARKYMATHRAALERTEKNFGVDRRVITAIILVESGLGSTVGYRSALNVLSTLAALQNRTVRDRFWQMIPEDKRISRRQFENKAARKSRWAYRELKAFLKYAAREGLDPAEIPGSYAGAVGLAQFMPSNILVYGKDGNNDGAINLQQPEDSMASIANFLKRHGWHAGISRQKAEKVIYHYNHSRYYVNTVLKIAHLLKG